MHVIDRIKQKIKIDVTNYELYFVDLLVIPENTR